MQVFTRNFNSAPEKVRKSGGRPAAERRRGGHKGKKTPAEKEGMPTTLVYTLRRPVQSVAQELKVRQEQNLPPVGGDFPRRSGQGEVCRLTFASPIRIRRGGCHSQSNEASRYQQGQKAQGGKTPVAILQSFGKKF